MMYKEYVSALFQSIKGKNLPTSVKIILGIAIVYIILPTDFIPDLGLPLGLADDTIIAAILVGLGGRIIYNKLKEEKNGYKADDVEHDDQPPQPREGAVERLHAAHGGVVHDEHAHIVDACQG